jgi:hypothetical protein
MTNLNRDLHLTTEFLILMRSGFYGQIVFDSTLAQLKSNFIPKGYLDTAHRAFDKIDSWMKDLVSEIPIFSASWETPETFDAISSMNFMKELRKDFNFIVPHIEAALDVQNLSQDREAVKLLVASLVRSAATRNAYVEMLSTTFSILKAPALAQQIAVEIEPSREYLRITQIIQQTFSTTAAYDDQLCEQLRFEAILTPGDFRALSHDTNVMINALQKKFTYELSDLDSDSAAEWSANKIPAVAAGYWYAYGFSPQDFLNWKAQGITGATLAANWTRAGFGAEEAVSWMSEGIPPMLAGPWREAGFQPARAAALIARGVVDPKRAPRYQSGQDEEVSEDPAQEGEDSWEQDKRSLNEDEDAQSDRKKQSNEDDEW